MAEDEIRSYSTKYFNEKLNIPRQSLQKKGFIESTKGRSGGFEFRKNPADIFVMDIINSVEGVKNFDNYCALHETWKNAKKK